MVLQRVIPSLLLKSGRLAKGVRFADHKDAGLPHTTARAHNAQGADEIVLLDIEASRAEQAPDLETIARVAREIRIPLTAGGGIGDLATARAVMAAGADKLCITTALIRRPELTGELARVFGAQAIVAGIDFVRRGSAMLVYDHVRGTATNVPGIDCAIEATKRGAGEIRLVAVDRDGLREGLDIEAFRSLRRAVRVPIILEGGAGTLAHVDAAMEAGADAVSLGTLLVFSDANIVKLKRYLGERGRRVRV